MMWKKQVRLYYGTRNCYITIMFTVCNGQLELLFKHSFSGSSVFGQYIFQCVFKMCVMANQKVWISPKIWSDRNFPASYERLSFFVCRQIFKLFHIISWNFTSFYNGLIIYYADIIVLFTVKVYLKKPLDKLFNLYRCTLWTVWGTSATQNN